MHWSRRCTVNVAGFHRVTVIEFTRLLLPHQHFTACRNIAQKVGKPRTAGLILVRSQNNTLNRDSLML